MLNLVLIHGAGDDHRAWHGQREFFAGSHAVLDVDLPGRGSRVEELPLDSREDTARDVLLGLVLVATGARLDVSPGVLDAARRRAEGHPDAPLRVRRLAALTMRAPPRAAYADLLANQRFDSVNRVPAITAPTLVIGCRDDRLVPLPLAEAVFNFTLVKFLGQLSGPGSSPRPPLPSVRDQGPIARPSPVA